MGLLGVVWGCLGWLGFRVCHFLSGCSYHCVLAEFTLFRIVIHHGVDGGDDSDHGDDRFQGFGESSRPPNPKPIQGFRVVGFKASRSRSPPPPPPQKKRILNTLSPETLEALTVRCSLLREAQARLSREYTAATHKAEALNNKLLPHRSSLSSSSSSQAHHHASWSPSQP